MMPVQVDEAIDIYRTYAKYPSVSKARLSNAQTPGHVRIYSEWKQRDLERCENVKFARNHIVQLDMVFPTPTTEIGTEQWNTESPDGLMRAIVRKVRDNKKGEDKQYIEIWNDTCKIQNIDVSTIEQHGKIYEDGSFGCFEWSYNQTHLLYVAEKKRPKAKSYFCKKTDDLENENKGEPVEKGEEFVFQEDWGEQLIGKCVPVLVVFDIEAGAVISTLDNLPENVSPGQGIWCENDTGIVCVGWWHTPYRLGLTYCPIRRSALFHIDLNSSKCTILGDSERAVMNPRFNADFSKLIYLDNPAGGPHRQCSRLMMIDWSTKGVVPIVEIVRKPSGPDFPGIYCDGLVRRCFAADKKRVIISSYWRSRKEMLIINSETGEVIRFTQDPDVGSWTVHDVHNDIIVASCSSPSKPHYLVIGHLPPSGKERGVRWTKLDPHSPVLEHITWRTFSVTPPLDKMNEKYGPMDYECYVLEPAQSSKSPLIVYPHGGPHSLFPLEYSLYLAALCRCGFTILTVNYRGSIGFGQDSIDCLPGNIGTQDVEDVQYAAERALELGYGDPSRVCVIGGSHGGFLTAHLIGQYPDFYKAACCRNPVINIASMLGTTDIPDWCYVEAGEVFDVLNTTSPTPEVYKAMWERSPIRYVDQIKTPVMIMLGLDDKRVPPKQGHELRKALITRNVPVRMLTYPDNAHPIIKVDSEADAFINIVQWFTSHI